MYSGQTGWVAEYDRQIKYLDYMENGQRSRGAGFVKLERRGDICNISLQVSGLYRKDHFTRPLLLIGDGQEQELCKLQLADGGIKTYLEGLDSHSLDGQGLRYELLQGIRIPISEGKEIRCLWGKPQSTRDSVVKPEAEFDAEVKKEAELDAEVTRELEIDTEVKQESEIRAEVMQEPETGQESILEFEPESEAKQSDVSGFQPQEIKAVDGIQAAFKEDKWSQLCAIYPHTCPFSDEREYLSFGLSDFVVLSGQSYKLVNNSFLLHGYYTHHYLILTRVVQRGNARYYIGVPGHLFDKEKRTAIMFGFEGFECESEPASEGDFGFYLIPVDI
ncbi:MAG: hypothetical protein K2O32_06185 [Acetatifactor sp.]|nr:hypothetical protein [Acetatifactor sp.]